MKLEIFLIGSGGASIGEPPVDDETTTLTCCVLFISLDGFCFAGLTKEFLAIDGGTSRSFVVFAAFVDMGLLFVWVSS